jgi:alcohol dehydrogenase/L-iditol 2-dehydrogenase
MSEMAVVNFASAPHSVELRTVPAPQPADDEVLIEVGAVGVCGSDLHQWTGDHSWPVNYPVILGHEFSGTVRVCGANVHGWRAGERVVSETAAVVDPDSPLTRQGRYNLDPARRGFGYGVDGAMTRYVRVPARCLHRLPDGLAFETAALTEPCCVAYSATVANCTIRPGDRVVVFGPGAIGLLCAALARLCGAEVAVAGLEQDCARLQIAVAAYGCEALVRQDRLLAWAQAVDGLGADGVVDAAGVSATLQEALAVVRPGGWISKVGWGRQPLGFSLDPLVQKNVTLQGCFSHTWPMWERVLRLLATGALRVEPLVGGVWPLAQWRAAFEKMHRGEIVKAVLKPEA